MDELVKSDEKIFDYLSSFSGIMKKMLNPVTTKLKDVQRQLKALPPKAELVGHSFDLDLKALKMIHPYVPDTSLLYVREQGRRLTLKFLAKAILGKDIQSPNRRGHDATEDARTTLELAQYFLKYGSKKMRLKWTEVSTVYAMPFSKKYIGALKRLFKSFGPVWSMTFVVETHQVQRPVMELTLDCDTLGKELECDSKNQDTIYLSGVTETFKEHLLQQSNLFFGLEAVILPKDLKNGQQKKYCFLKFKTFGSAQRACNILTSRVLKLKGRHTPVPPCTSTHGFRAYLLKQGPQDFESHFPPSEQQILQTLKVDHPKTAVWHCGQKMGKLYHSLSSGILCLILLPGTRSKD